MELQTKFSTLLNQLRSNPQDKVLRGEISKLINETPKDDRYQLHRAVGDFFTESAENQHHAQSSNIQSVVAFLQENNLSSSEIARTARNFEVLANFLAATNLDKNTLGADRPEFSRYKVLKGFDPSFLGQFHEIIPSDHPDATVVLKRLVKFDGEPRMLAVKFGATFQAMNAPALKYEYYSTDNSIQVQLQTLDGKSVFSETNEGKKFLAALDVSNKEAAQELGANYRNTVRDAAGFCFMNVEYDAKAITSKVLENLFQKLQ